MAKIDAQELMATIRERMAKEGPANLEGMNPDDIADAVAHPKAAATIQAMFELEPDAVQQGDVAPAIELPWLGARPVGAGERFSLASHRTARPVALIFGSYT
jgi:hypothetical protein